MVLDDDLVQAVHHRVRRFTNTTWVRPGMVSVGVVRGMPVRIRNVDPYWLGRLTDEHVRINASSGEILSELRDVFGGWIWGRDLYILTNP